MTVNIEEARSRLKQHGQDHVLRFWDDLSTGARRSLLAQIESLNFERIEVMQALLQEPDAAAAGEDVEPAPVANPLDAERTRFAEAGAALLAEGKGGVLLVAGGQGSRLGFDGPKGAFPIGPVSGATLFEIHARKVMALERRYGSQIPFYIMTSETNDADTRSFFAAHDRFGLSADTVQFFKQGMWPALDPDGRIMLECPDRIFMSPDGHGGVLRALKENGMLEDMRRRGLEHIFMFQVDNPLVEILDPVYVGMHAAEGAEVSCKVCAKRDPDEGLGVVVLRDGKPAILEYTELTEEQKHAVGPDGRLRFLYGSVAIHVFSLPFLERMAAAELPIHVAHKKVPFCNEKGETIQPETANAFKFEKFIFDVLPHASRTVNLAFKREEEFSPVKNASGSDSPATAQRYMVGKFARWFESAGVLVPRDSDGTPTVRLDVDPCFALDAAELAEKLPAEFSIDGDVRLSP